MGWNDRLGLLNDEEVDDYIASAEDKAERDEFDEFDELENSKRYYPRMLYPTLKKEIEND
ncbi:MAG TPA: hypothetical protein VEP90_12855 [Methylomirabilota bacterium]|nr:hypothetical protein [Methylomirabilota bacterium]